MLSLYGDTPGKFDEDLASLVKFGDIADGDIPDLSESTGINLAKTAARYSDGIILGSDDVDRGLKEYCKGLSLPMLEYSAKAIEDGSYIDAYNNFYESL